MNGSEKLLKVIKVSEPLFTAIELSPRHDLWLGNRTHGVRVYPD
jgi:hypothetical protein